MSNVMELSLRGASSLEKLMRAVLLDSDNKVPADRLRIVGALSEGAIIEQGSNANGDWVRLADGTQVCYGEETISITTRSQNGKYYANVSGTYPAVFLTAPSCHISADYPPDTGILAECNAISSSIDYWRAHYMPDHGLTDQEINFRFLAIGRWKA